MLPPPKIFTIPPETLCIYLGHFEKLIINIWNVLNYVVGVV